MAPSCTDQVPLLGADGYYALRNQVDALAAEYDLHPHRVRGLLDRYGSLLRDVLDPARADDALLATVPGAPDYLMAEISYAVTHEGALHLEDVLARRTRISIEYPHRGVDSAPAVASLIGGVLGWSARSATPRSRTTPPGSRPSASRSPTRTTRPPTRSARAAPEVRAGLTPTGSTSRPR